MAPVIPLLPALAGAGGLGTIATGLGVVGAVVSTASTYQANKYQAEVLKNNARLEEQNAERALMRGAIDQQDQDFAAAEVLDAQLAQQAATGFSVDSGSLRARRARNRTLARQDSMRIRADAELEGHNFRQKAQGLKAESNMAKHSAKMSLISGALDVGSNLINGASRVKSSKANSLNLTRAGVY